jgi:hypothetical protein
MAIARHYSAAPPMTADYSRGDPLGTGRQSDALSEAMRPAYM